MIIWLHGPSGVGKATVGKLLVAADPTLVLFDLDRGYTPGPGMPQRILDPVEMWDQRARRTITGGRLAALHDELAPFGASLVVPHTVTQQRWWIQTVADLAARSVPVCAFVLDVAPSELRRRIDDDTSRKVTLWPHQEQAALDAVRGWLSAVGEVVDTTDLTAEQVAARIRSSLAQRRPGPTPAAGE